MPLKVILDTNFLFVPVQYNVDIFQELERVTNRKIQPIILSAIYEELKMLDRKGGVEGKSARIALRYADNLKILDVKSKPGENVDNLILRVAADLKCPVATNDRFLRKKLRNISIAVIYLRQKSHLAIEGNIVEV